MWKWAKPDLSALDNDLDDDDDDDDDLFRNHIKT